jgi:PadR family transcriptional regulator, regulatory protein PadR
VARTGRGGEGGNAAGNKPLRDFFLGFIQVHVLTHASREAIYGAWFLEELERHGYHVSPGTLYPLLHDLQGSGFLRREDRVVDGRVRKYYLITPAGQKVLHVARDRIKELVDEILEDDTRPATR